MSTVGVVLKQRSFVIALAVALISVAWSAAPASAQYYYTWEETGSYLWGNLTWSGGKGRIVWGPASSTEDNVLPWDDTSEPLLRVGDDLYAQTNVDRRGMPPPDVFESDPLPMDLHVNVTRPIQLEVQLKDHANNPNPCNYYYPLVVTGTLGGYDPLMEAELKIGDKFLAAGRNDAQVAWQAVFPSKARPTDPDGYGTCRFPMYTEFALLEKGAVMKLSLLHIRQDYYYPYGFGEGHVSTIKIPFYSEEEVIYRYPPVGSEAGELVEEGDDMAANGAGLLALLGLAFVPARRRGGVTLAVLLLVVGALAGCITGGSKAKANATDDDLGGTIDNSIGANAPYLGSGGAIRGLVFDNIHIPVPGVHVSILGTANFTETDAKGRFVFENLRPDVYRLRFDQKDFKSLEGQVTVKEGKVSLPKVMMIPKLATTSDLRPHQHDYWPEGAVEKKLSDVRIDPTCSATACTLPTDFRLQPTAEDANTILPGTYEVEITMNWNADQMKVPKLGLQVMANHQFSNYGYNYQNMSRYAPRAPGEAFHVRTSWETTDAGHQPYSTWKFSWYIGGEDVPDREQAPERSMPGFDPGGITVKMKLHKGELPLEGAHPDRWKGSNKAVMFKDAYVSYSPGQAPPGTGCTVVCDRSYFYMYVWYPSVQGVVPKGTKWVEASLTYTVAPTVSYDWILKYKPANIPFYKVNQQTGDGFKDAPAPISDSDPKKTTWRFEIKDEEADSEYARTSAWLFYAEPDNKMNAWLEKQTYGPICCLTGYPQYSFSATARNDAKP